MTEDEHAVSLRSSDSIHHTIYVFVFPVKLCPPVRPPLATRSYLYLNELKLVKLDILFLSHKGHRSKAYELQESDGAELQSACYHAKFSQTALLSGALCGPMDVTAGLGQWHMQPSTFWCPRQTSLINHSTPCHRTQMRPQGPQRSTTGSDQSCQLCPHPLKTGYPA